MVFVSTKELENRQRRDLMVDEDEGEVDVHTWALAKELATSPCDRSGQRPPCAGHAMLAALEVDDAVLGEEDTRRTSRDARMPATLNMVATAIRHRHDVGGSNLGTTLRYTKLRQANGWFCRSFLHAPAYTRRQSPEGYACQHI